MDAGVAPYGVLLFFFALIVLLGRTVGRRPRTEAANGAATIRRETRRETGLPPGAAIVFGYVLVASLPFLPETLYELADSEGAVQYVPSVLLYWRFVLSPDEAVAGDVTIFVLFNACTALFLFATVVLLRWLGSALGAGTPASSRFLWTCGGTAAASVLTTIAYISALSTVSGLEIDSELSEWLLMGVVAGAVVGALAAFGATRTGSRTGTGTGPRKHSPRPIF